MPQDAEYTRIAVIVEDDKELRALAVALLEETNLRVVKCPAPRKRCSTFTLTRAMSPFCSPS